MIKVSFFYPYRENVRFDIDYYCKSHMPWVAGLLGSAAKGWSVDAGLAGGAPGSAPTYVAAGHVLFDSVDAFTAAVSPHLKAFADDIVNYYPEGGPPVVQISDVRAVN